MQFLYGELETESGWGCTAPLSAVKQVHLCYKVICVYNVSRGGCSSSAKSSGAGGWNLFVYSGWADAKGSRCWQNLHLLSKCDLLLSHHLILKRGPDHICLVATFIIVFHFLIIDLGQRAPWVRKHMWESKSVCSGLPYSMVKHSFLPVCSCPALSCCFICLSKLFWHLGLNTLTLRAVWMVPSALK